MIKDTLRKKRALITGIRGQDGSYLSEFLLKKGYEVFGLTREMDYILNDYKLDNQITLLQGDLCDIKSITNALDIANPDEIYNLAAQSQVGRSFQEPKYTSQVNYTGAGNLITEAFKKNPVARIYQASSSEMFGPHQSCSNETTPFNPVSPYGISKQKTHEEFVIKNREINNFFICSGFLFNHESPRRGVQFVTRKVTSNMTKIKLGLLDKFELGNIDVQRDWGYAKEYVEAMWLMLQQKNPEDFVIATGKTHSIRDFIEAAATALGMTITWQGKGTEEIAIDENGNTVISISPEFYRPNELDISYGDNIRAREQLGWQPETSFAKLVEIMIEAELKTIQD